MNRIFIKENEYKDSLCITLSKIKGGFWIHIKSSFYDFGYDFHGIKLNKAKDFISGLHPEYLKEKFEYASNNKNNLLELSEKVINAIKNS